MKSKEDILLRIEPEGIELDFDNVQVIRYYSQEQIYQAMEEYANQIREGDLNAYVFDEEGKPYKLVLLPNQEEQQ